MAPTGHRLSKVVEILIVQPRRKGSVLLALIMMRIIEKSLLKATSERVKCARGSNFFFEGVVYSETLKRPKNAVKAAATNMYLSGFDQANAHRCDEIFRRWSIVMGLRCGRVFLFP